MISIIIKKNGADMVNEISKDEKPRFNSRPLRVYMFKYLGNVGEEVGNYVYIGQASLSDSTQIDFYQHQCGEHVEN